MPNVSTRGASNKILILTSMCSPLAIVMPPPVSAVNNFPANIIATSWHLLPPLSLCLSLCRFTGMILVEVLPNPGCPDLAAAAPAFREADAFLLLEMGEQVINRGKLRVSTMAPTLPATATIGHRSALLCLEALLAGVALVVLEPARSKPAHPRL